jgi:serine/threonine protein kinase
VDTKPDSDTRELVSADDALPELCFSDAVFRERYEGWRVLGRGPWATVVRTRSRDLGQDIALKVFVNLDPELLQRVRQEVRAVQALATPYLVHTYSLFDRGTIAWFEMEVVDGPNLQQELDRLAEVSEAMPLVRAYEIALAVSRCVWHAHRYGVLHRDIKPANVLLPLSRRPAAKVSDFGIARLADVAESTPPGVVTGTPRFASPEALAGQVVGTPHDVYCLGATLYTLLAGGRSPHEVTERASLAILRRLQETTRPAPLSAFVSGVDPGVESVLMQALAAEPADRPGPGRLVRALERAQARVVAAAGQRGETMDVSVPRWRVLVAGIGLAAFGLWTRFRKRRGRQRESGRLTRQPEEEEKWPGHE